MNNCRIHFVLPADADLWSSRLGGNLALSNLRQLIMRRSSVNIRRTCGQLGFDRFFDGSPHIEQ